MGPADPAVRRRVKSLLASAGGGRPATGVTTLIYHRIGGGTTDELDVAVEDFARQVDVLTQHRVVGLDQACDEVLAHDERPKVVLTFDDGFTDVHERAWPLLRAAGLPFTIYLTTGYVGRPMQWEGATRRTAGTGLTWAQLQEMVDSGLCTIGNHTHTHPPSTALDAGELDRCTAAVEEHLGVTPAHFAWTWGLPSPDADALLAARFRTAATGAVGRADHRTDPMRWPRIPVRRTDPLPFFTAKLTGGLLPERTYELVVRSARALGLQA